MNRPGYIGQEYHFYLGDRELGPFYIPHDNPQPKPIERRLITAPAKTQTGSLMTLVWIEERESIGETMIWSAETSAEANEAQRLFEAAHGLNEVRDEQDLEFTPTARSEEEQRLIQAILAEPDNDEPLLKYADLLTMKGCSQGEFIRVDRELDSVDDSHPDASNLNEKWTRLLTENEETWFEPLSALHIYPYERAFWMDRGYIYEIEVNRPTLLLNRSAQLFDAAPLVQKLTFDCEELDLSALAQIPQLAQIRDIALCYQNVAAEQLAEFLDSPYLDRLTELDLTGNDEGVELVRVIVNSRQWPHLRSLQIANCELNDEAMDLIASGKVSLALQYLRLGDNSISSPGWAALSAASCLTCLDNLDLANMVLQPTDLAILSRSPWIPQLETLCLKSVRIDQAIAIEFTKWPLINLRNLDISLCGLRNSELRVLLESQILANIFEIDASYNEFDDVAITELVNSPHVNQLQSLDLSNNPFGDAGIAAIADSPRLAQLHTLKLTAVDMSSAAATALAASPFLHNLRRLDIGDENQLTDFDYCQLKTRFGEETVNF